MSTVEEVDPELTGEGEEGDEDVDPSEPAVDPQGEVDPPKKISVAQRTFEAVQAYIGQGKSKAEAFEQVASDTDRAPATVTTAYYRWAREHSPDSIKAQPRGPRAASNGGTAAKPKQAVRVTQGSIAAQLKGMLKEQRAALNLVEKHIEAIAQMEKDAAGIATARKALGIK